MATRGPSAAISLLDRATASRMCPSWLPPRAAHPNASAYLEGARTLPTTPTIGNPSAFATLLLQMPVEEAHWIRRPALPDGTRRHVWEGGPPRLDLLARAAPGLLRVLEHVERRAGIRRAMGRGLDATRPLLVLGDRSLTYRAIGLPLHLELRDDAARDARAAEDMEAAKRLDRPVRAERRDADGALLDRSIATGAPGSGPIGDTRASDNGLAGSQIDLAGSQIDHSYGSTFLLTRICCQVNQPPLAHAAHDIR
eukprot:CAMPEP_0119376550 /NCGR_PEP_ID=MMETSP1334-20130426/40138_1 /TAXON_ID=127549 /ORGANISM="Calcidiscus leptoporus, Strain RCC1130" /LENGTH=253 /DNA_ID=CAMNT_0007395123 /DNA_START=124 /DNA_END=886 /DNA_ORIENTATION=-